MTEKTGVTITVRWDRPEPALHGYEIQRSEEVWEPITREEIDAHLDQGGIVRWVGGNKR